MIEKSNLDWLLDQEDPTTKSNGSLTLEQIFAGSYPMVFKYINEMKSAPDHFFTSLVNKVLVSS